VLAQNASAWAAAIGAAEREALKGHRGANPLVGAVILAPGGEVVASGFHRGAGHPHAEVEAISALGPTWRERAGELTLVVTLEPCRLTGRTGPCVRAVLEAGLGTVVYAAADPTPNGGGGAELARAGVSVHGGVDPASAGRLNPRWSRAKAAGRPFVTAHLAQSLDAKVADAAGRGRWISGPEAREHSHAVRARVGTIVVGTGTVLADDPALTVRLGQQPERAVPVVIAGASELPATLGLARRAAAGADVVRVRDHDPHAVLAACGGDHVLLEGGPTLLAAFIEADLVDELFLYQAPLFLGPGVDSTAALSPRPVGAPWRWAHDPAGDEPDRLGRDLLLHLSPAA
jgi:diaminohydroxyphosphoribosylaminopyrimidine deaminase / 5-amino-6-(5-phosphoribosylamino)uracil reductase